jgi:ring-1,2-phenylacetyl-CoA epoxidase subunit PaaC
MSQTLAPLLIALGDDELILGHRHSEWTGWAPHIEEDVAFSSIAQDELGHAAAYYALAAKITGQTPDEIAFGREPAAYRNALLCERPNGNWAYTLARHWLYDHADDLRLASLEGSSDPDVANLATKMRREERYHLLHADTWLERLANGPVEGRSKLVDALAEAYPDALALFEAPEGEDDALAQGLVTVPSDGSKARFVELVSAALDGLGLPSGISPEDRTQAEFVASSSGDLIEAESTPGNGAPKGDGLGGRSGHHTDDFRELWDVMTSHYRGDPGATW